jgi:hypothetical protein
LPDWSITPQAAWWGRDQLLRVVVPVLPTKLSYRAFTLVLTILVQIAMGLMAQPSAIVWAARLGTDIAGSTPIAFLLGLAGPIDLQRAHDIAAADLYLATWTGNNHVVRSESEFEVKYWSPCLK